MANETPETNGPQDPEKTPEDQATESQATPAGGQESAPADPSRRSFFKRVAIGGGIALAGGGLTYAGTQAAIRGRSLGSVDAAIQTDETFKPKDQRDLIFTQATSPAISKKHPGRDAQYSRLNNKKFNFLEGAKTFEHRVPFDNNKTGFTQLDKAIHHAAWYPLDLSESHSMAFAQPNTRMFPWDQSDVEKEQYEFPSKEAAAHAIKSAARVWGAARCGITRRDKRWDYDPLYDVLKSRTLSWEKDFPFEPKTVIVIAVAMDYDALATAPAWTAESTIGHGYVVMAQIASQMAKFIRGLGYHAVGAGNDLGNSVAYAIAAGLGEGGRHAQLIVPGIGPRVRLCKVYTDLEFVEYDQPHDWGITKFCLSCGECAKACPSKALPFVDDVDSGYGFKPTYEHSDEPGYTWNNHTGVLKFHSDAKRCFNFWIENDSACGNCAAACTFNEPDYWHHWFTMGMSTITPGIFHGLMSKMHPLFGYGETGDPHKVDKFWKTGKGMRVNPKMLNNRSTAGYT